MTNLNRDDWNEDWAIVDGAGYHDIQVKIYSLFKKSNPEQYESCLDLKFFILVIVTGIRRWTCCFR